METEINSQGAVIENLINKYIVNYCVLLDIPIDIKRIVIIASGSSYNAGIYGKNFFERIAKIPCYVEHAAETIASNYEKFEKDSFYIFLSQSGMSVDTLEAMNKIKELGAKTLCVTNCLDSTMYKIADYPFYINAGVEQAIAATKTYSATVVMLWLIAIKAAQNKRINITEEIKEIYQIRKNIETAMESFENIDLAAKALAKSDGFAIFGLGYNYALSLETALKIKETSYIHTSAYPSGEFVHGHFALLNNTKTFLTFLTQDACEYEKSILKKVLQTYKTKSIIISDTYEDNDCDILIKFPKCNSKITSIINMIILIQTLALKIAICLKRNVDNPQGLVKIVDNKG